ncbi:hypothetical protein C8R44DRAFT_882875 [Mycena epipterygia]|nr:hypothetical protein C8R44DRAFT_882875 [Mycena epipterygia]
MLPLPPAPMNRERRQWTAQEDELLRLAVSREEPGNPAPSKWHAIAQHVPNRTNKDCRKRWYAKMSSDVVKGGWSPEEDQRLLNAIDSYGTRWSLVASMVQTRNSDQCAKRWCDTLNPAIDRTAWSSEADDLLIQAVNEHGKVWTKIVQMYFPGRTGLAAKNRYNSITRAEGSSRSRRHTPDSSPSPSTDIPDSYYPDSHSSRFSGNYSQSNQQPGHHSLYHSSQEAGHHPISQSSGHRSMSHSMARPNPHTGTHPISHLASHHPGYDRGHNSTISQLQPPTNPGFPIAQPSFSQPQSYYPTSDTRYPSSSQYQGPPPTLPSNNPAFPDYSLLGEGQYPQQQMQYPNPALNPGYTTSKYPPGGPNQASAGSARNASDPRNWGPY